MSKLSGPAAVWVKTQMEQLSKEETKETAHEEKSGHGAAAKGEGPTTPSEPSAGQPDAFVPGALVLTSFGTHKDKFDQKRAEIVSGGSKPTVKFLEGPAAGTLKEMPKNKLTLLKQEPSAKEQLVPAAGTAKGASAACSDQEAVDKAARAAQLFGLPAAP